MLRLGPRDIHRSAFQIDSRCTEAWDLAAHWQDKNMSKSHPQGNLSGISANIWEPMSLKQQQRRWGREQERNVWQQVKGDQIPEFLNIVKFWEYFRFWFRKYLPQGGKWSGCWVRGGVHYCRIWLISRYQLSTASPNVVDDHVCRQSAQKARISFPWNLYTNINHLGDHPEHN
jgi:hypothetical protein